MHGERPVHVAFYGTLMSPFAELERLGVRELLRLVGACEIPGRLYDLGDWPTLVAGEGVVRGELYELLDERVFAVLDPFEECDPHDPARSAYLREPVWLLRPRLRAWVYLANHPVEPHRHIAGGSWTAWRASRDG